MEFIPTKNAPVLKIYDRAYGCAFLHRGIVEDTPSVLIEYGGLSEDTHKIIDKIFSDDSRISEVAWDTRPHKDLDFECYVSGQIFALTKKRLRESGFSEDVLGQNSLREEALSDRDVFPINGQFRLTESVNRHVINQLQSIWSCTNIEGEQYGFSILESSKDRTPFCISRFRLHEDKNAIPEFSSWFRKVFPNVIVSKCFQEARELECAFYIPSYCLTEMESQSKPTFPADRIDGMHTVQFDLPESFDQGKFSLFTHQVVTNGAASKCWLGEENSTLMVDVPCSYINHGTNGPAFESRIGYLTSELSKVFNGYVPRKLVERKPLLNYEVPVSGDVEVLSFIPERLAFVRKIGELKQSEVPFLFNEGFIHGVSKVVRKVDRFLSKKTFSNEKQFLYDQFEEDRAEIRDDFEEQIAGINDEIKQIEQLKNDAKDDEKKNELGKRIAKKKQELGLIKGRVESLITNLKLKLKKDISAAAEKFDKKDESFDYDMSSLTEAVYKEEKAALKAKYKEEEQAIRDSYEEKEEILSDRVVDNTRKGDKEKVRTYQDRMVKLENEMESKILELRGKYEEKMSELLSKYQDDESFNYDMSSLTEATAVIASLAKRSGKSVEEVEKLWAEAIKQAEKAIEKKKVEAKSKHRYAMGILRRMLKLSPAVKKNESLGESISLDEGIMRDFFNGIKGGALNIWNGLIDTIGINPIIGLSLSSDSDKKKFAELKERKSRILRSVEGDEEQKFWADLVKALSGTSENSVLGDLETVIENWEANLEWQTRMVANESISLDEGWLSDISDKVKEKWNSAKTFISSLVNSDDSNKKSKGEAAKKELERIKQEYEEKLQQKEDELDRLAKEKDITQAEAEDEYNDGIQGKLIGWLESSIEGFVDEVLGQKKYLQQPSRLTQSDYKTGRFASYTTESYLNEDVASRFFDNFLSSIEKSKDAIWNKFLELKDSPQKQEEAISYVQQKFGISENKIHESLSESSMMEDFYNNVLGLFAKVYHDKPTLFGTTSVVVILLSILVLGCLVLAVELYVFSWLFGGLEKGIVAYLLIQIRTRVLLKKNTEISKELQQDILNIVKQDMEDQKKSRDSSGKEKFSNNESLFTMSRLYLTERTVDEALSELWSLVKDHKSYILNEYSRLRRMQPKELRDTLDEIRESLNIPENVMHEATINEGWGWFAKTWDSVYKWLWKTFNNASACLIMACFLALGLVLKTADALVPIGALTPGLSFLFLWLVVIVSKCVEFTNSDDDFDELPDSDFALPKYRKYPMHTERWAANSLAMLALYSQTQIETEEVKNVIFERYPNLKNQDTLESSSAIRPECLNEGVVDNVIGSLRIMWEKIVQGNHQKRVNEIAQDLKDKSPEEIKSIVLSLAEKYGYSQSDIEDAVRIQSIWYLRPIEATILWIGGFIDKILPAWCILVAIIMQIAIFSGVTWLIGALPMWLAIVLLLKKIDIFTDKSESMRDSLGNILLSSELTASSLSESDGVQEISRKRQEFIEEYKAEYQKLIDDEYRAHQDETRKLWPLFKNFMPKDRPSLSLFQIFKDLWGKRPIAGQPTINFRDIYAAIQLWKSDRAKHMVTVRTSGPKTLDLKHPEGRGVQISADVAYEEALYKYGVDIERLIEEYDAKAYVLARKYQEKWEDYLQSNKGMHSLPSRNKLTDLPFFLNALRENLSEVDTSILYESSFEVSSQQRCMPCVDVPGNYILAESNADIVVFYHGVAFGAKAHPNAMSFYPRMVNLGKVGKPC
jgi:hypothetical protein